MVNLKRNIIYILLVSLSIFVLSPNFVFGEKNLVFDEAGLFTQDEIRNLETEANNLSLEYNMDIVIVTTNDAQGKSSRAYADDYFDYGGFGQGSDYDGILFLIDMDNREAYISTSGIGIRYLTDQRIESVLDVVFDDGLSQGNYFGAANGFLNETRTFLERGIPAGQYNEPEPKQKKITPMDILISILGGLVTGAIFFFTNKTRYKTKRQTNPYSYRSNSFVNFNSINDNLVDTIVTHRLIPKNNNISSGGSSTSGRSTTHRSSSGRSHGGGGRKF